MEIRTYAVNLTRLVSSVVDVEVDASTDPADLSWDDWMDLANASDDMPGGITVGAFGAASVDEAGEWELSSVTADGGMGAEIYREAEAADRIAALDAALARLRAKALAVVDTEAASPSLIHRMAALKAELDR